MIWELRHEFKIWLLIDIAKIPRSTYYYYSKQFDSPKPDKYAEIKSEIRRIYDESKGHYGYRRITKELKKKYVINHKTVQKLMRKMGIFCRVRMHKYNSYKGSVGKIAPNLLERDFKADNPNTTRGACEQRAILRCLCRTASQYYVVLFCFFRVQLSSLRQDYKSQHHYFSHTEQLYKLLRYYAEYSKQ